MERGLKEARWAGGNGIRGGKVGRKIGWKRITYGGLEEIEIGVEED